jgi:cystathionine beta-synthase
MREKRLLEPQRITASILVSTKVASHPHGLVAAEPTAKVGSVLAMMQDTQLSLIPVIDEGEPVGSVRENRVLAKLLENRDLLERPINEIMDPTFPVVEDEAGYSEIVGLLQKAPAILVREYGRITGILTRHDLLDVPQAS